MSNGAVVDRSSDLPTHRGLLDLHLHGLLLQLFHVQATVSLSWVVFCMIEVCHLDVQLLDAGHLWLFYSGFKVWVHSYAIY